MAWRKRIVAALGITLAGAFVAGTALASTTVDATKATALVAFRPAPAPVPTSTTTLAPTTTTTTTAVAAPPAPLPTLAASARVPQAVSRPAPAPLPAPQLAAAAAPAPVAPAAPSAPAEVGAAALALIDFPWQRLGYSLTFGGPNPGLLGKTDCGTKQAYVYVRSTQTVEQVAFVTAFELGHAVDCGTMTDARRAEWASIRGFAAGWQWFPSCVCAEDNFGSGDISMVFAHWLVPTGGYRWRSNLAPPPSADMLRRLLPYLRPAQVG